MTKYEVRVYSGDGTFIPAFFSSIISANHYIEKVKQKMPGVLIVLQEVDEAMEILNGNTL